MAEIWKDIEGYEGYYQVSNLGNVRTLHYLGSNKIQNLKPHKCGSDNNYYNVHLCKNGKTRYYLIHRLVANAFIDNPDNLNEINHKDENPANNCADNLEWCNHIYNINYGSRTEKARVKETNGKGSKPICQYSLDGKLIKIYPSINEARRDGYKNSHIIECCRGYKIRDGKIINITQHKGYKWKYLKDDNDKPLHQ